MNAHNGDDHRPRDPAAVFAPWVEWREEVNRSGRRLITAVNHRDGKAIYVDPAELTMANAHHGVIRAELRADGFLDDAGSTQHDTGGPTRLKGTIVWRTADQFVRAVHDRGGHRLFRPNSIAAQIAVAVAGAVMVAHAVTSRAVQVHAHPTQIPAIIVLGLVAVFTHELGHAIVTVHYGRHVRLAGLRLHLGAPAFYVESLDALLLTRRQRLVQAAAGPWAEWLFTSVIALLLLCVDADSSTATVLQRFVVINTIVIASNLLPFVGLDGALLFADAIGRPDLPFRTRIGFDRRRPRETWILIYSTVNALVATGLLAMAGYFWWQLFGDLAVAIWAEGPVGVTVIATVCFIVCWQLSSVLLPGVATVASGARWAWSKLVFRYERRWRVEAINAFRSLPELAALGPADLGVIAGRLHRYSSRSVTSLTDVSGHLYVRRGAPAKGLNGCITRRGRVIVADEATTRTLATKHDVVVLPTGWQDYVSSTVSVAQNS